MRTILSLTAVSVLAASTAQAGTCPSQRQTRTYSQHAPTQVAYADAAKPNPTQKDIVDTAVNAGSFKTLVAAVKAAGLVEALKGKGPFTVLAPTDKAFAKLPEGTLQELLRPENKKKLQSILTYHVIPGAVPASEVVKLDSAKTLQGQKVSIAAKDGKVMIDGANVVKTDIHCKNGIIHVIDAVILPAEKSAEDSAKLDVVDTAVAAKSFSTLVTAVKAAGLVEALKGKGPFTIFAPTDEAFAKLPEGTLENLLKPENKDQLQAILTYHVVSGRVMAADVVKLNKAETLNGKSVNINVTGDKVQVNDANVVKTDIECANGVIHVIDSVILP